MGVEYRKGLNEAHRLLRAMHDRLEDEHLRTPGFFGFPTRRHHEIMGATRMILEVATQIANEIKRDSERHEPCR